MIVAELQAQKFEGDRSELNISKGAYLKKLLPDKERLMIEQKEQNKREYNRYQILKGLYDLYEK